MKLIYSICRGRRPYTVNHTTKFISRLLLIPYITIQLGLATFISPQLYAEQLKHTRYEVISQRTESSKTFSLGFNEKGREEFEIISFADKVHYYSANGWKEVNNDIIQSFSGKFVYRNAANDFTFRAGVDLETGVQFVRNSEICEFKLDNIKDVELTNSTAVVNKNSITYPNIYPNADLEFTVHSTGIITEVVVKNQAALKSEITFALTNCRANTFDTAIMSDADSGAKVKEKVVQQDDGIKLILEPDYSQLGEIKGEVRIDPSISSSANADTFVSPSTYANGTRRFMAIGTYYDSTVDATFATSRALVDFGILQLPTTAIPISAKIQTHHYGTNSGHQAVQVARITSSWNEASLWPGPSSEGNYGDSVFPHYNSNSTAMLREIDVDFSLIDYLKTSNNGVMLKYANDASPGVVICSRNIPSGPCHDGMEPKLVVHYAVGNPPNIPILDYPNEGWELGANAEYESIHCDTSGTGQGCDVDFRVKAEDSDNNFPLETIVEIRSDEGGNAEFIHSQLENGWFIQTVHLNDGHWHWKARAKDSDESWSEWSSTKSFVVDTTAPSVPLMNPKGEYTKGYFSHVKTAGSTDAFARVIKYEFQISDNPDFSVHTTSGWMGKYYKFTRLGHNVEYHYRVRSQDNLGNVSEWSPTITSIQDGRAPSFINVAFSNSVISPQNQDGEFDTTTFSFDVVEDYWKSTYVRILDSRKREILFYSGLGQQVSIEIDGKDADGNWLPDGIYRTQRIAHDLAGNITSVTEKVSFVIDNTPSVLNISFPAEGAWFNTGLVEISGITNTDSTVYFVNSETTQYVDVDVDFPTGIFSESIGIIDGKNRIQLIATDPYSNQTQKTLVVYREDGIPDATLISLEGLSGDKKPAITFNLEDKGDGDYCSGINPDKTYLSIFDVENNEIVLVNEGVNVSSFGHIEHNCVGNGAFGLSGVSSCTYSYIFDNELQPDGVYSIYSRLYDVAGNERVDEEESFEIDSHTYLTVTHPQDGELFNYSLVNLQGSAERGAILSITGDVDDIEFLVEESSDIVSSCRVENDTEICDWEVSDFQLDRNVGEDIDIINSVNYKLTDPAGNVASIDHTYTVNLYAVNLSASTDINYFSPNGDGRQDGIDFINLETDGVVDLWEIRIKSDAGELVRILEGSASLPANVYWNGRQDGGGCDYVSDGDYSYSLYLKTTDGIEFETGAVNLYARTELDDSVIITYPQNNLVTTRGVVNVQGQAPQNTNVRICVDTIGLNSDCDFEYYSDVDANGSFSTIVPLVRLDGQTQTEHFITAQAFDQFGNSTDISNQVRVVVDTRNPFISVAALPALTGVNNEEDYQVIVDKLNNGEEVTQEDLDNLRTVILRSTVTQNTEYVQLAYADFTNLDELPEDFDYSNLGYIDGENVTRFGATVVGNADLRFLQDCNAAECTWDFYYPVPPVVGGVYEIEFEGKKGETVEKLYTSLMIDGTIPLAPIILDINKIVEEQVLDTNLFQGKHYSNSALVDIIGGADPNTDIRVYDQNDNLLCSTTTNAIGIFSCSADIAEFYPAVENVVHELNLSVKASDGLNETVSLEETFLVVDKVAPAVLEIESNGQWRQSGTVAEVSVLADEFLNFIHFTTPEYTQTEFSLADDYKSGVGTIIISGLAQEGNYSVRAMVSDIAGNYGYGDYVFYLDNTKPDEPTIDTSLWGKNSGVSYENGVPAQGRLVPEYVVSDSNLNIYGWGEEDSVLDFYLDGNKVGSVDIENSGNAECVKLEDSIIKDGIIVKSENYCKWTYELTLSQEKGFVLTTKSIDRAGNESLVSEDEILYLDQTAPLLPLLLGEGWGEVIDQESINVDTESEKLSDIEYWVFDKDGGELEYISVQNDRYGIRNQLLHLSGEDGVFTIRIRLTDAAGNRSDDLEFTIIKDTTSDSTPSDQGEEEVLGTDTGPDGMGGGESRIEGAEVGDDKEWGEWMGCNVMSVKMQITLWPDGNYSVDNPEIEPPVLTLIKTEDDKVTVYGTALEKGHAIEVEIQRMAMTYDEAKASCNIVSWKTAWVMNGSEKDCMESRMNIENLNSWYTSQIASCWYWNVLSPVCVNRRLANERAEAVTENHEFEAEDVMVSFHRPDGTYVGHLWNDDWTGRFKIGKDSEHYKFAEDLKIGDRIKARVNLFGTFDINGIEVDYGGEDNSGAKSGYGNTLTVGEPEFFSVDKDDPDYDSECPGIHNSDYEYTVGTAATLLAGMLTKSSEGWYAKFKCNDPYCEYIPQKAKDIYSLAGNDWKPIAGNEHYVQCTAFVHMAYKLGGNEISMRSGHAITFAGKEWKCNNYDNKDECLINNNIYADQFTVYASGESTTMPEKGDLMVWEEFPDTGHVGIVTEAKDSLIKVANANSDSVTHNFLIDINSQNQEVIIKSLSGGTWIPDYWARKK